MEGKRRSEEAFATMRGYLAATALSLLSGCIAVEERPAPYEDLRSDLHGVRNEMAAASQAVAELADVVKDRDARISLRLEAIEHEMAQPIHVPTPICEAPEPVIVQAPEACEAPLAPTIVESEEKITVGQLERIRIEPQGAVLTARIDTGANSNSLSAENLVYFERDGEDWVRFEVHTDDGQVNTLEREVQRHVRVIQQSDPEGSRRPMVYLRVRLGNVLGNFEFNLTDRSHLKHPVILGREFLADLMLVDVGQEFLVPLPVPGS